MKKLMADISLDNATLKEAARGKLLSLFRRRRVVAQVCRELNVPGTGAGQDV